MRLNNLFCQKINNRDKALRSLKTNSFLNGTIPYLPNKAQQLTIKNHPDN